MIHIWLPSPNAPLRIWQATSQDWQIAENWQELATLIGLQHPKNKQTCLYFPSMLLLHIQPNLNATQLKQLGELGRKYLFEELSIAPVEDLQIKTLNNNNLYALHASDRKQWENLANLSGLNIVAMLPDFCLLDDYLFNANDSDTTTNQAIFYQDNATQLLKTTQQQGFAIPHLPLFLHKLLKQTSEKWQITLTGNIDTKLTQELDLLENIDYQLNNYSPKPITEPQRHALNFALNKKNQRISPYAKVIGFVVVLALLTLFVVDGLRIYHYQQATKHTKTLLKQQYEQWFPNESFNPRLKIDKQIANKLINQQNNDNGLMTVLASIQPILQQNEIIAKQLNYQNNRLQLQLIAKDSDSLTRAINALNTQQIHAKLGTVTPSEAGAVASVEIGLS
ncbi:hypothetical protein MOMA_05786 [Moraxella macacae 0408225]|uniref:GspL periplasmic domain-containing protein n=1 Tax=Moraxella macacae 0408225 TaxID=1230338 RepID=L2F4W8_9GAMM|nr:GspL/Epsl periplasmic domain-containing protein [Moraxella macacae]ELA08047.1 hypothetical protein MOMA_05786 [Moraxella macacae 0408225]